MESCWKVKFASKQLADEHILRIQKRHPGERNPQSSYQCRRCHSWHLTSQPDSDQLKRENQKLTEENERLTAENKYLLSMIRNGSSTDVRVREVKEALRKVENENSRLIEKVATMQVKLKEHGLQ